MGKKMFNNDHNSNSHQDLDMVIQISKSSPSLKSNDEDYPLILRSSDSKLPHQHSSFPPQQPRLASLDVFRGLTVAVILSSLFFFCLIYFIFRFVWRSSSIIRIYQRQLGCLSKQWIFFYIVNGMHLTVNVVVDYLSFSYMNSLQRVGSCYWSCHLPFNPFLNFWVHLQFQGNVCCLDEWFSGLSGLISYNPKFWNGGKRRPSHQNKKHVSCFKKLDPYHFRFELKFLIKMTFHLPCHRYLFRFSNYAYTHSGHFFLKRAVRRRGH